MAVDGWLQLIVPPLALVGVVFFALLHRETNRRDPQ